MKIIMQTNITGYNQDTLIKPKSCYWFIRNTGNAAVNINNKFTLLNSADYDDVHFGIDTLEVLAATFTNALKTKRLVPVQNDTEFLISFSQPPFTVPGLEAQKAILIETHFKLVK